MPELQKAKRLQNHFKNSECYGSSENYFVELGKYGKYKVVEEKAYNEKHPHGKPLDEALGEANENFIFEQTG